MKHHYNWLWMLIKMSRTAFLSILDIKKNTLCSIITDTVHTNTQIVAYNSILNTNARDKSMVEIVWGYFYLLEKMSDSKTRRPLFLHRHTLESKTSNLPELKTIPSS